MDGLKISIEYFLDQFENVDFLKTEFLSSSTSVVNSGISNYNFLGQINFTSVNLFTSQLMLRIDSMASDLNNSKMTCSINGFSINAMYAPSATLACLKACELLKERIIYFSVMRINFGKDIKEVSLSLSEEIYLQWSPAFHLNVLHLYEDISVIYTNLYNTKVNLQAKDSNFKGYNMNLKLDGKINLGMLLSNENDRISLQTEYFTVSYHCMNQFSCKCEQMAIFINDVLNCNVEASQFMNTLK